MSFQSSQHCSHITLMLSFLLFILPNFPRHHLTRSFRCRRLHLSQTRPNIPHLPRPSSLLPLLTATIHYFLFLFSNLVYHNIFNCFFSAHNLPPSFHPFTWPQPCLYVHDTLLLPQARKKNLLFLLVYLSLPLPPPLLFCQYFSHNLALPYLFPLFLLPSIHTYPLHLKMVGNLKENKIKCAKVLKLWPLWWRALSTMSAVQLSWEHITAEAVAHDSSFSYSSIHCQCPPPPISIEMFPSQNKGNHSEQICTDSQRPFSLRWQR